MGGQRPCLGWWTAARRHLSIAALALTAAATVGAPAAAQEATPGGTASYEDPEFGWSIRWDRARWSASDPIPSPGQSVLNLSPLPVDGEQISSLYFIPLEAYGGDPAACIADAPALINGWTPSSPDYEPFDDAVPLLDAAGAPIAGETADTAYAGYVLDTEGDGVDTGDPVEALDCRTLVPGRAVLLIRLYALGVAADPAAFVAEAAVAADLLDGLELPTTPSADPGAAVAPVADAGLVPLLPTVDEVPPGLEVIEERERSLPEVAANYLDAAETERLFAAWGWRGNAARRFGPAANVRLAATATASVYVSVHRFGDAASASAALNYSVEDQLRNIAGAREVNVGATGDRSRALVADDPDGVEVTVYAQRGDLLVRVTAERPVGDPIADALAVARGIVAAAG